MLLLFPESYARPIGVIVVVMLGAALYEFLTRWFVTRRLRQDAPVPAWIWYLNVLLETNIPTIGLFVIGFRQAVPVSYLVSSFIMLYAVFIVLSTLRLDARLSLFTGGVAAVGYTALAFYFLSITPAGAEVDPRFLAPVFYINWAIVLLLVAVGAAFVAREVRRRLLTPSSPWRSVTRSEMFSASRRRRPSSKHC